MKQALLTILRDHSTSIEQYRAAVHQLGQILAVESGTFLQKKESSVETALGRAQGTYIAKEPVLIAILRSGLTLLPPFLEMYPKAPIGTIGVRRNEKTAKPRLYYQNLPRFPRNAPIFLLDPMLATGGSALLAVDLLKKAGAEEKRIVFIGIIASQEGLMRVQKQHPLIRTHIVQVDPTLNAKKMIVPGLGDFGDRYFGT